MFVFLFLTIDLYLLIPAAIAQVFNPFIESVTLIGLLIKEAKEEIEIHPVIAEAKKRKSLK